MYLYIKTNLTVYCIWFSKFYSSRWPWTKQAFSSMFSKWVSLRSTDSSKWYVLSYFKLKLSWWIKSISWSKPSWKIILGLSCMILNPNSCQNGVFHVVHRGQSSSNIKVVPKRVGYHYFGFWGSNSNKVSLELKNCHRKLRFQCLKERERTSNSKTKRET